eukprot:CAMPEP_0179117918 /NCGR_PEP_ID=MMETSP0796-20121207/55416_1 /TAXON_ID=73915 /ORGANISM="Pyrodinium bahamense, Strain pbaha01" /LENGTH=409 /DNA_ID=CAMNT_0020816321 /DNA_START=52 /DNA_END=1278 /DNA_ORIENTATION=-
MSTPAKRRRQSSVAAGSSQKKVRQQAGVNQAGLPVILVTGFLGAGKTTLVNCILRNARGLRAAVFVNEYGAADIDGELLRLEGCEEERRVFTLKDGCICCGSKDDLRNVIVEELSSIRAELDVLIIETSGITDPAPVLATLAGADGVYVDSVICVVDATTVGDTSFGAGIGAKRQIGCADVFVLSKVDLLAGEAEVAAAERSLLAARSEVSQQERGGARSQARVIRAVRGEVGLRDLCGLSVQGRAAGAAPPKRHWGAEDGDGAVGARAHHDFANHSYFSPRAFDRERFEAWAASPPCGVLRAKGLLSLQGEPHLVSWHLAAAGQAGCSRCWGASGPRAASSSSSASMAPAGTRAISTRPWMSVWPADAAHPPGASRPRNEGLRFGGRGVGSRPNDKGPLSVETRASDV